MIHVKLGVACAQVRRQHNGFANNPDAYEGLRRSRCSSRAKPKYFLNLHLKDLCRIAHQV